MSADLEVVLDRKEADLVVPTQAVLEHDVGGSYVYVLAKGRIEERPVSIGLSNWNRTEILSGIRRGEEVVVSLDLTGLKAGVEAVADTVLEGARKP